MPDIPAFLQSTLMLLAPLRFAAENEEYLRNLAAAVGWDLDEVVGFDATAAAANLEVIAQGADTIADRIATPPSSLLEFVNALDDIGLTLAAVRNLTNILGDADTANLDDFGEALLEALVIAGWFQRSPISFSIAEILGLVVSPDDGPIIPAIRDSGRLIRVEHRRGELRLDRLKQLLRNPVDALREEYFAGDALATTAGAHRAADKLFPRLARLGHLLGIGTQYGFQPTVPVTGGPAVVERLAHMLMLYVSPNDAAAYGATLALSSTEQGRRGLLVRPYGSIAFRGEVFDWNLQFGSTGSLTGLILGPDGVETRGGESWSLTLAAEQTDEIESVQTVLGGAGTGMSFRKVRFEGGFDLSQETQNASLDMIVEQAHLAVTGSDGDGFLASVLPSSGLSTDIDFAVGWSNQRGFHFSGSGSLTGSWPLHRNIGPVSVESLELVILAEDVIRAQATLSVGLKLGPLDIEIQGVGLEALVDFPEDGGNLGVTDLDLHFKPPNGLGLSIDGGGFSGGGFLRYVEADQHYEGALELEYEDKITLKAIGMLTTRLPGGKSGFSLLIIITAEFNPIQLGLGFTLNGVGGLLGLNRTANAERLRSGLRDNTLNGVLFPQNVVANASRILSDLSQLFPAKPNRFIFGPMARIGWGSPTLITIDVGLLIEIPQPVRVLILGVIRALLPDEKAKLLRLQVNFLGVIDFEGQQFSLDASLYDSKLLSFTLSGDMAVRVSWGANPNLLLSVGGFHPAYEPPPLNLPTLRRLSLQLTSGDNPRLTLETYFAITSNTVQFGAKIELLASAGSFSVYGFLSFDVLFQFNPFYFIASISAKLALLAGGSEFASISLDFTLEGPTPWRAHGTAKLKICWFLTITVSFDKTFGETRNTTLPDIPVLPLLKKALSDPGNWESQPAGGRRPLVSLREIEVSAGQVVASPVGVLTIQQKVVPLGVEIQHFGSQRSADGNSFTIDAVTLGEGNQAEKLNTSKVREQFAPAQFFEMTEAQKLSSKSFERFESGVKLVDSEVFNAEYAVRRVVDYELSYIDEQRDLVKQNDRVQPDIQSFHSWALQGAVASSPLSHARNGKSALAPGVIQVSQEGFAVVSVSDLRPVEAGVIAASEVEAQRMMNALVRDNPALEVVVVPAFEVNLL